MWASEYELRSDGYTLTDVSQKQYLEDVLLLVRRGMERPRAGSEVINTATTPVARRSLETPSTDPPKLPVTSTPIRLPEMSRSMNEDLRYETDKVCNYKMF